LRSQSCANDRDVDDARPAMSSSALATPGAVPARPVTGPPGTLHCDTPCMHAKNLLASYLLRHPEDSESCGRPYTHEDTPIALPASLQDGDLVDFYADACSRRNELTGQFLIPEEATAAALRTLLTTERDSDHCMSNVWGRMAEDEPRLETSLLHKQLPHKFFDAFVRCVGSHLVRAVRDGVDGLLHVLNDGLVDRLYKPLGSSACHVGTCGVLPLMMRRKDGTFRRPPTWMIEGTGAGMEAYNAVKRNLPAPVFTKFRRMLRTMSFGNPRFWETVPKGENAVARSKEMDVFWVCASLSCLMERDSYFEKQILCDGTNKGCSECFGQAAKQKSQCKAPRIPTDDGYKVHPHVPMAPSVDEYHDQLVPSELEAFGREVRALLRDGEDGDGAGEGEGEGGGKGAGAQDGEKRGRRRRGKMRGSCAKCLLL
jgi:hypothetical protein